MIVKSGAGNMVLCGTLALAAVGTATAEAGVVEIKYLSSIYGATAQATVVAGPSAGNYNLQAPGLLVWEQTGVPENPNYPSPFASYCSEIAQFADFSSYVYTENTDVAGTLGGGDATALAKLWQKYDAGTLTGVDASAFQLVVYNILYDTDLTVAAGNFFVTSDTASLITTADAMMAWLLSAEAADYTLATLTLLENQSKQDQLYGVPNTGNIPEPATAGIALFGAGALLMRRRK